MCLNDYNSSKAWWTVLQVSVFDHGLQCFKDVRRCRDNFVVVGASAELPPLLTAWKPDDTTGPLLAVGLGNDLAMGVHFEYLFCSCECPIGTESQYSLLAQVCQHLVTSPPVIQRDQVPEGYLDDETAVSSLPGGDSDSHGGDSDAEVNTSAEELTDKVKSLAIYCSSSWIPPLMTFTMILAMILGQPMMMYTLMQ